MTKRGKIIGEVAIWTVIAGSVFGLLSIYHYRPNADWRVTQAVESKYHIAVEKTNHLTTFINTDATNPNSQTTTVTGQTGTIAKYTFDFNYHGDTPVQFDAEWDTEKHKLAWDDFTPSVRSTILQNYIAYTGAGGDLSAIGVNGDPSNGVSLDLLHSTVEYDSTFTSLITPKKPATLKSVFSMIRILRPVSSDVDVITVIDKDNHTYTINHPSSIHTLQDLEKSIMID